MSNGNQQQLVVESFYQRTPSPCIDVTSFDDDGDIDETKKPKCAYVQPLRSCSAGSVTNKSLLAAHNCKSDSEFSDRYFTASSGDDLYTEDDTDGEEDDEQLCIDLDLDGSNLSGLHIDLKTLSAVSSMLAHYNPIIQSDENGMPVFVAPPPPPEHEYYDQSDDDVLTDDVLTTDQSDTGGDKRPSVDTTGSYGGSTSSECVAKRETDLAEEDFESALAELDDAILKQDTGGLFSDAITELTDVMEKMANFISDPPKQAPPTEEAATTTQEPPQPAPQTPEPIQQPTEQTSESKTTPVPSEDTKQSQN